MRVLKWLLVAGVAAAAGYFFATWGVLSTPVAGSRASRPDATPEAREARLRGRRGRPVRVRDEDLRVIARAIEGEPDQRTSSRERLRRHWDAFVYNADPSPEQQQELMSAIADAEDALARGNAQPTEWGQGGMDNAIEQWLETGRTIEGLVEQELQGRAAEILTPEQLEAWRFDVGDLEVARTFVEER